jgi:hypothetical protein
MLKEITQFANFPFVDHQHIIIIIIIIIIIKRNSSQVILGKELRKW